MHSKIFLIAMIAGLSACTDQSSVPDTPTDTITITYVSASTDDGRCRPEGSAVVNKAATQLYKIHGENYYEDVNTGEVTNIPLQFIFRGADIDTGLSSDQTMVGINTDTSCESLRIRSVIQYCQYEDQGREETACRHDISITGDGFADLVTERADQD